MTSLFLIPDTNKVSSKGRFRRIYLWKAVDLTLAKKICLFSWNFLIETLTLLKLSLSSFLLLILILSNPMILAAEFYFALNTFSIEFLHAFFSFITCSKSIILVYLMFFFVHLILRILVLFNLFFYALTISEVHLEPSHMSKVGFFANS